MRRRPPGNHGRNTPAFPQLTGEARSPCWAGSPVSGGRGPRRALGCVRLVPGAARRADLVRPSPRRRGRQGQSAGARRRAEVLRGAHPVHEAAALQVRPRPPALGSPPSRTHIAPRRTRQLTRGAVGQAACTLCVRPRLLPSPREHLSLCVTPSSRQVFSEGSLGPRLPGSLSVVRTAVGVCGEGREGRDRVCVTHCLVPCFWPRDTWSVDVQ